MNIYRRHYWSLWIDFIKAFAPLQYKGIPLPLLCVDIYRYLNNDVTGYMHLESFTGLLKTKIYNESDIQREFDAILSALPKDPVSKAAKTNGKILLDNYVLRIPEETILTHFKTDEVFYVTEGNSFINPRGLHYYGTQNYSSDHSHLVYEYVEKAKRIFSEFGDHPVFGSQSFQEKIVNDISEMVDKLVTANNLFDQIPISCVVIGAYETFLNRSLIFVSRVRGIPSIWLEHGIIGDKYNYGWHPVLATKHAVYGQYEVDWYTDRGVSRDRLEITGNATFDQIFTKHHMPKEEFNQKLNLNPQNKKVLLATNEIIDKNMWEKMANYLLEHSFVEVIVKTHPPGSENERSLYYDLSRKYSSITMIDKWDFHIHDVLANVDVVVIDVSTVGLEAMLFDKPVVSLIYPHRVAYNYDYFSRIDEFIESDPIKAGKIIIQLLTDKSVQKLNKKRRERFLSYAYPQTLSSDKIVHLINKMKES